MYIVVGLGNPGVEYAHTRHNLGRMAVSYLEKKDINGVKYVHLETFMNKSGSGVVKVIKSKKSAQKLIVIYDDLDLGLGQMKISYNRSSGGHRGVESIIKALKTEEFIRIRVGISPVTPSGKLKRVHGESEVEKHILTEFKKTEAETIKKVFKRVYMAVETIAEHGLERAMTECNK
jgi:PTH1 family peptidyl-tRNA hydrolase